MYHKVDHIILMGICIVFDSVFGFFSFCCLVIQKFPFFKSFPIFIPCSFLSHIFLCGLCRIHWLLLWLNFPIMFWFERFCLPLPKLFVVIFSFPDSFDENLETTCNMIALWNSILHRFRFKRVGINWGKIFAYFNFNKLCKMSKH